MKNIKDIIISTIEPSDKNVGWLKPMLNKAFILFFFGGKGWTPVTGNISLKYIQDIPDIIISPDEIRK